MWQTKKNSLYKEFKFKDFNSAFSFMSEVAKVAEKLNHHPLWTNNYNEVKIWLSTHEPKDSITEKDKQMASEIDRIHTKAPKNDSKKQNSAYSYVKIYTDGGSRGNPGPSASGYVLMDPNDKLIEKRGIYLGITTNNQAEYKALQLALGDALSIGVKKVDIYMDSLLIVNQLKGTYKVRNRDLLPIYEDIKKNLANFESVSISHIPRSLNSLADGMVNEALDEALGIS